MPGLAKVCDVCSHTLLTLRLFSSYGPCSAVTLLASTCRESFCLNDLSVGKRDVNVASASAYQSCWQCALHHLALAIQHLPAEALWGGMVARGPW